ncbi:MAG: LamG-like jellyroll fold domain-containing protein [Candidatus Marinimicrobia bacterium]|nr:LamG-like jellyroll fold domain-containing protein [Candidatus Neomarinimicrobiota bacterium]
MNLRWNILTFILLTSLMAAPAVAQTNRALNLDGVDEWVKINSVCEHQFTGNNFTIECWGYLDSDEDYARFIAINTEDGGNKYLLSYQDNNGFTVYNPGGGGHMASNIHTKETWMHMAVTFSGSTAKFYLNGELISEMTGGHSPALYPGNQLSLGQEFDGSSTSDFLKGRIDEVRIWNTVRTQYQIQRTMDVEIPADTEGLVAYYNMDGTSSFTLLDHTSNGYDGFIYNRPSRIGSTTLKSYKPYFTGTTYYISDKEDLYWASHCVDAWGGSFYHTAHIACDASDFQSGGLFYHEGQGWLPIGSVSHPFTGMYNGNNKTVSGLVINPANDYSGYFGYTNGASIQNLGLLDLDINSSFNYSGALAGAIINTGIDECFVASDNSDIAAISNIGGLLGYANGSTIRNSYTTAAVSGDSNVGGICGNNRQSNFENCYAAGPVSCGSETTNGFIAYHSESGIYTNNFFDTQTTGQSSGIGATAKTTAQMQNVRTFIDTGSTGLTTAWDMKGKHLDDSGTADYWDMDQAGTVNNGYPILSRQTGADNLPFIPVFSGQGTAYAPFLIESLNDLQALSEDDLYWGSCFKQTANIDASATASWNENAGFKPIGNALRPFTGVYYGNEKIIEGLTINRPTESCVGFFGYLSGTAKVDYLWLKDVNITGDTKVGGLVGHFNPTSITYLKYLAVNGTVSANDEAGMVVGNFSLNHTPVSLSHIEHSYAQGAVTRRTGSSGTNFGGFAGAVNGAKIKDSYSTAAVCESEGVSWSGGDKGFVGADTGGTYTNLFFDTGSSGQSSDAAATGKTSIEMKDKNSFLDNGIGWFFIGRTTSVERWIWGINPFQNNGYPFMIWQPFQDIGSYSKVNTATNDLYYSVTMNGEITYVGSSPIVSHGFCWHTEYPPTLAHNSTTVNATPALGEFSADITGLSPSTKYYYRTYIITEADTIYSTAGSNFTTQIAPPFTGSGTAADPLQIGSLSDLQTLRSSPLYWDDYFILTADIDAANGSYNLGTHATRFTGSFDGNGHTISNLQNGIPSSSNVAFFPYTQGAVIKNLNLVNANITGYTMIAPLIAYCHSTVVKTAAAQVVGSTDQTMVIPPSALTLRVSSP